MSKMYENEKLMRRLYLTKRWTPKHIAEFCGCDQATIYRYIKKFGLKR